MPRHIDTELKLDHPGRSYRRIKGKTRKYAIIMTRLELQGKPNNWVRIGGRTTYEMHRMPDNTTVDGALRTITETWSGDLCAKLGDSRDGDYIEFNPVSAFF